MKRAPIARRTPLVAHRVSLRRTPLVQVSAKRARENRARKAALAPLRAAQDWCSRCGKAGAGLDGHELLSRARGGSITDPANVALLCRDCHDLITREPVLAAREGWALSQFGRAS